LDVLRVRAEAGARLDAGVVSFGPGWSPSDDYLESLDSTGEDRIVGSRLGDEFRLQLKDDSIGGGTGTDILRHW
jgi:hypothetical protein